MIYRLLAFLLICPLAFASTTATITSGTINFSQDFGGGSNSFMTDALINIKDFGAIGDGTNDDTAAIQGALNAAITNYPQGCVVYAPIGHYMIKGALQTANGNNSQLLIPPTTGYPARSTTIRIQGPTVPAQSMFIAASAGTLDGGAVFESTITGTGGAVIGTHRTDYPEGFNTVTVDIENLTIQARANPQLIGVNMRQAFAFRARGLRVWTGVAPFDVPQPTGTTSIGIATPTNNNAAFTRLDDCQVCGFYTGYEINEHTTGDNNSSWACMQSAFVGGAFHASHLTRFMTVHCPYGIVFGSGIARLNIDQYDVEHIAGNWKANVMDVADAHNTGYGQILWAAVLGNVGFDHSFNTTGTNIWNKEIGTEPFVRGTNAQTSVTPALPPDVGVPLLASWDIDGITNLNTQGITFIPDQWTNGYHLLPSNGNRAAAVNNDLNGHTTADFGPSFITYVNSSYAAAQPHEVFIVSKITDGQTYYNGLFDSTTASRNGICLDSATGLIDFYTVGHSASGLPIAKNKWIVWDMVYDGASSVVYTNGVLAASGDMGSQAISGFQLNGIYNYVAHTTIQRIARVDTFSGSLGTGAFAPARSNVFCFITNRYKIAP